MAKAIHKDCYESVETDTLKCDKTSDEVAAHVGLISASNEFRVQEPSSLQGQSMGNKDCVWKLRFRQALTASGTIMATNTIGITFGFSAILLPQLALDTSEIKIELDQYSWIGSTAVLSMPLGSIVGGYLMEQYGRRTILIFICMLSVIGWVLFAFANTLWMVYFGRLLTGFCVGMFGPTSLVYIAETSDSKIRGVALAAVPLSVGTGILFCHGLGTLLSWKLTAVFCSIFPFVGYILLFPAPESPIWLASKGRFDKAEESFRWLRGYSVSATKELTSILKIKDSNLPKSKYNFETLKAIIDFSFLKPLIVMNIFFVIQQYCGVNAVIFYSISVLSQVTSSVNEYISTLIIDTVRVIMSGLACILLKKFSRRFMAICSAAGTSLSLFILAFSIHYLPSQYSWVSLLSIISYTCFISIGIIPLPWIMIGEVFPQHLRELGSGVTSCFGFAVFFCVVKTSPYLMFELGVVVTFTIFGTVALLGSFFLYFFLPETRNKTLQEIEDDLKK